MVAVLAPGTPVGVVDDTDRDAEATSEILVEAGFSPVRIPLAPTVEQILAAVKGSVGAVVCDHRLSRASYVAYNGAEVVARCVENDVPGVLITTWANTSDSAAIRKWLHRIPRVLKRGTQSNPEALADALQIATAEAHGDFSLERRAHRTVVRLIAVEETTPSMVEIIVPAWRPLEAVVMPAAMIQEDTGLTLEELAGKRVLADVNIYAGDQSALYAQNFELLAEPPADWMSVEY